MIPLLVCDDSNMARKQLIRALPAEWPVTLSQAANGEEALALIRQGQGQVMLLDLVLVFQGREDDLDIEVQENVLTIAGKRTQSEDAEQRNYLHRGIAERSFERRFHLADHVQVREASLENGLLRIQLEREIPEAKKPRRIAVNGKSETKLISADKASAA